MGTVYLLPNGPVKLVVDGGTVKPGITKVTVGPFGGGGWGGGGGGGGCTPALIHMDSVPQEYAPS